MSMDVLREHALQILRAGIAAAEPRAAVRRALRLEGDALWIGDEERIDLPSTGRVWLAGAGKAAAGMALGVTDVLGARIAGGTITTVDRAPRLPEPIEVWEAAHPVPDTRGLAGAAAALELARGASADDLLVCVLSGGASALWPAPPAGVTLADLQTLTGRLLRAGAAIREVNTVRKHLSRIAGGQLARAAHPARVLTLVVSDVVGSPLDVIGSGPTVPDPTTFGDAREVLERFEVEPPAAVRRHLEAGVMGGIPETPRPGDPLFLRVSAHVVADNRDALEGAAREAGRLGYRARVVADDMEGEARGVAWEIVTLARRAREEEGAAGPLALLLGGETTVTVTGPGKGGRNQELALAAAVELEGEDGVLVAACGTDGVDGPARAAGGVVDGGTLARGAAQGLDARACLSRNDSHTFLKAAGALIETGPTGTNVNDLALVLIAATAPAP